jgi:hypothetical protein
MVSSVGGILPLRGSYSDAVQECLPLTFEVRSRNFAASRIKEVKNLILPDSYSGKRQSADRSNNIDQVIKAHARRSNGTTMSRRERPRALMRIDGLKSCEAG